MRYEKGQRVALVCTDDPHTLLRPGDEGTVVRHHEGIHTVDIHWDNGSRLSMCLDAGDRIQLLPVLRRIWRDFFDGDTHRFTDRLLAQDWAFLDAECAGPVAGAFLVAGIGQMDWSGQPDRLRVDLHDPRAAIGCEL